MFGTSGRAELHRGFRTVVARDPGNKALIRRWVDQGKGIEFFALPRRLEYPAESVAGRPCLDSCKSMIKQHSRH